MVAVDDTALAVTDTDGPVSPWSTSIVSSPLRATGGRWVAELGPGFRHITYDERARGKSRRSADYSFEAAVRDVDAVLAARDVDRALVVGWSYGAVVAAHWAARNPDRALGAVLVDGAFPHDRLDEAMEQRIRKLFKRLGWFTPLLRPTGLTPRMTAEQMADSNIEFGRLSRERELGPVLDDITVPVRYVVASGTSFGSRGDEQERIRTSLDAVIVRTPNIHISAKVASNHGALRRRTSAPSPRPYARRRRPMTRAMRRAKRSGQHPTAFHHPSVRPNFSTHRFEGAHNHVHHPYRPGQEHPCGPPHTVPYR
ncbi:alpha/beta fold hydrolase [Nocardia abscessus]|uniref:alpha/beta fold hydrolase n=1 Tax=Nocardia abscessus TaxID=120957 RepID=UPI001E52787D|nr:alpha/beta fold hydrolase [Nocardia abscessus]